ncbi:MAG: hypothetical protein ACR2H6_12390, partial [Pyrinomonadaceae bacterium]
QVSGDVEYLINRTSSGWLVTLLNNNGVNKPPQGLANVDRSAVVTVMLSMPGQRIRSATNWINDRSLEITNGQTVSVAVPPGGIAIVEMK